eukprot:TRINITY_DN9729_c0_g1_i4.p2 TRINITY_DN9729_c0_g1~~TRINITY_DN9729_c0_g1_i4.p2  ORF type:complete len:108 (+),score=19.58 TRINITY_DN9729_c0_g1_i4:223-546(+)
MEIALVMVAGSCIKQHLTLSILFDAQHGFGGLVKNSRGIVQFGLSPFRQKAVGQHFTKGPFNFVRKLVTYSPYALPGLLAGAAIWKVTEDMYAKANRKNVADFEHET